MVVAPDHAKMSPRLLTHGEGPNSDLRGNMSICETRRSHGTNTITIDCAVSVVGIANVSIAERPLYCLNRGTGIIS